MLTQSTNIEAQFSKPYPAPARIDVPYYSEMKFCCTELLMNDKFMFIVLVRVTE